MEHTDIIVGTRVIIDSGGWALFNMDSYDNTPGIVTTPIHSRSVYSKGKVTVKFYEPKHGKDEMEMSIVYLKLDKRLHREDRLKKSISMTLENKCTFTISEVDSSSLMSAIFNSSKPLFIVFMFLTSL